MLDILLEPAYIIARTYKLGKCRSSMFDRCVYFNSNALARAVNRIWEEAFSKYGLSPAHAYVLRYVLAKPGCTQKAIAQALDLSESTVTRFIDVLVTKHLLERKNAEQDRRASLVNPTEKGLALQNGLETTGQALYEGMQEMLGASRLDDLVAGMRNAREHIGTSSS